MSRRFHPLYHQLKQAIENEQTGQLERADIFYYGGWLHNGIHVVDTLRYLFESDFEEMQLFDSVDHESNDPTFSVRCKLQGSNADIWIHGLKDSHYQVFDFDFKFTGGRLQIRNFESDITWEAARTNVKGESVLVQEQLFKETPTYSPMEALYSQIGGFLHGDGEGMLAKVTMGQVAPVMKTLWRIHD